MEEIVSGGGAENKLSKNWAIRKSFGMDWLKHESGGSWEAVAVDVDVDVDVDVEV